VFSSSGSLPFFLPHLALFPSSRQPPSLSNSLHFCSTGCCFAFLALTPSLSRALTHSLFLPPTPSHGFSSRSLSLYLQELIVPQSVKGGRGGGFNPVAMLNLHACSQPRDWSDYSCSASVRYNYILDFIAGKEKTPPLVLYGAAQAGLVPKKRKKTKKCMRMRLFKINNPADCSMKILLHVFGLFSGLSGMEGVPRLKFEFCCIFKRFTSFLVTSQTKQIENI